MDMKKMVQSPFSHPPNIELSIRVNDLPTKLDVPPTARLVDLLREEMGLTGTKISCEIGRCGACAVHMNGKLVNACLVMAYQANQTSIDTIEGLAKNGIHPIQQAFLEEGGFQCGYCTPGMIMAAKALLDKNPDPTPDQIQEALSGNLCRCTGYGGIIRAVQNAVIQLKENLERSNRMIPIEKINQMKKEEFVDKVGWVFEHSPWVAEKAWESLPVASREELLQAMVTIVQNAGESLQLALLRAHPDLGTRLELSEVSQKEQAGAGLNQLSQEEYDEFLSLNKGYVKKFGFPFIMAVKGHSKDKILAAMKQRTDFAYEEEYAVALLEVYKIAKFRLEHLIL